MAHPTISGEDEAMRSRATVAAASLCLAMVFGPAGVAAEADYEADYTFETADFAVSGHINVAAGKERREEAMEGTTMITIRRDDLGKQWMLMPTERMYMETQAGQPAMGQARSEPTDYETELTTVGPEAVNGLSTTKSKVIMTGKDGSKMGGFWWTTDDGVLVKMDVIGVDGNTNARMKRELSNIVFAPQDPALFEIPAGYTSMGMGFGAGMMGLPTGAAEPSESDGGPATEEAPKKKRWGLPSMSDVLKSRP
jgi:hypothetical protein